jgi:hypothetical protein
MDKSDYMDDLHARILRVTEDLRAIQRELNYAAMQVPGDPELMEALNQLPEVESIQLLKTALDQMRHFLWFYSQVMSNDSEIGEKLRQTLSKQPANDALQKTERSLAEKYKYATDTLMLRHLAEGKNRKPN